MSQQPEVWLRGPVDGYPQIFQPIVHSLLQTQEELHVLMTDFPDRLLWNSLAGMANTAFHLQHMAGVLDRMATYAKAEPLSPEQFEDLRKEGVKNDAITSEQLVHRFDVSLVAFLQQIRDTDPNSFTDYRSVGRADLPSTVGGILFHAAEHAQRHLGQLLTTVRMSLYGNGRQEYEPI